MKRFGICVLLLGCSAVHAQRAISIDGRTPHTCESIVSGQPWNPYAYIGREHCYQSDDRYKQQVARIYGKPEPSLRVLSVPAHGTPDAKRYGVACMGGLVMLRLKNGWQQALDSDRRYYRCRDR